MADEKKKNIEAPEAGVSQELDNFELWVVEHRKGIMVTAAVLVVVIATGICSWRWYKGAEERSRAAFAKAATSAELETNLKKHSKGPSAGYARLRLAKEYEKAKQYDKAAAVLMEVVKDKSVDSMLRSRAELNAGRYFEYAKKDAEAIKAYTSVANNAAYQEDTRAEASYCLGCLYLVKKDYTNAKAALKRAMVTKPTQQTTMYWSQRAKLAMDSIPAGK